jgi:hypothetical protein
VTWNGAIDTAAIKAAQAVAQHYYQTEAPSRDRRRGLVHAARVVMAPTTHEWTLADISAAAGLTIPEANAALYGLLKQGEVQRVTVKQAGWAEAIGRYRYVKEDDDDAAPTARRTGQIDRRGDSGQAKP